MHGNGAGRMSTAFTILFALAVAATFACGARKQWRGARMTFMVVALLSFLMALATAVKAR